MSGEMSAPEAPASADLSIEQAVSMLQQQPEHDQAQAEETQPTPAPAEPDSGADEIEAEAAPEDTREPGTSEEDQPEEPAIEPPASWDKEAKDRFAKLPREDQEYLAKREGERERFVNSKAQETAEAKRAVQEHAQWAQTQLQQALEAAQLVIEGEFAGLDWGKLQQADPAMYQQLAQLRADRIARVQVVAAAQQEANTKAMQRQAAEAQEALRGEVEKVMPVIRSMVGDAFEPEHFKGEISAYLTKQGVPADRLSLMSQGWELTLATKAMLYDKGQAQRDSAAAKVASAPKVQRPQGRPAQREDDGRLAVNKARERLDRSGSIEDAIALLNAQRGAGGTR